MTGPMCVPKGKKKEMTTTEKTSASLVSAMSESFAEELDTLRTQEGMTEERVKSLIDALAAGIDIFSPVEASLLSTITPTAPAKGKAKEKAKEKSKKRAREEEKQPTKEDD